MDGGMHVGRKDHPLLTEESTLRGHKPRDVIARTVNRFRADGEIDADGATVGNLSVARPWQHAPG